MDGKLNADEGKTTDRMGAVDGSSIQNGKEMQGISFFTQPHASLSHILLLSIV